MARKLKVDFTDVESYVRCEEGQHVAIIKEIGEQEAKESGNDMLVVKFEVIKGTSTGATVYNNFVLVEKALWRLKQLLEAVGIKAEGKVAVDLDKLVGKKLIIEVGHEEYNGQLRARLQECKPLTSSKKDSDEDADDDDFEDEDEDEQPKKKSKKSKKPEPEDEDEEEEEEEKPAKKDKKKEKDKAKGKKKPKDDDDDDDDDWED